MYLNNSDQEINSSNQVPYSPDLPDAENLTGSTYSTSDAWQITTTIGWNNFTIYHYAECTNPGWRIGDLPNANDVPFGASGTQILGGAA